MLHKAKILNGYSIHNSHDETIGKVKDIYFDDRHWTVRYLVVSTGTWLISRQVLLSPYALVTVNGDHRNIVANLTKKQIEDSPSLDSDKPVSRQYEEAYYGYFGWQPYWEGPNLLELSPNISIIPEEYRESVLTAKDSWDSHLHSTHDMSGNNIQATDGEIGHVVDFVIDVETWAIRYLVVDTRNWLPGKKVLVSLKWIESISWDESKINVNLLRETIRQSPEYTEDSLLTRDYESRLHKHYNREGYWINDTAVLENANLRKEADEQKVEIKK